MRLIKQNNIGCSYQVISWLPSHGYQIGQCWPLQHYVEIISHHSATFWYLMAQIHLYHIVTQQKWWQARLCDVKNNLNYYCGELLYNTMLTYVYNEPLKKLHTYELLSCVSFHVHILTDSVRLEIRLWTWDFKIQKCPSEPSQGICRMVRRRSRRIHRMSKKAS